MNAFGNISNIYFLGIGGIGMSALACYFKRSGKNIHGYDLVETPLTRTLRNEGMHIVYADNPQTVPANIELVVYTPAVPEDNRLFMFFKNNGVRMLKRAEVLGMLSESHRTIAIAGTHGKTSITALTSNLFSKAGVPLLSFIGGMAKNFGGNFVFDDKAEVMIAEADEYDRSLLHLKPHTALISNVSPDHLDVYGTVDNLENTFLEFAGLVPAGGNLIVNVKLKNLFSKEFNPITYGIDEKASVWTTDIGVENGKFKFTIGFPDGERLPVKMQVPGKHSVENALGVAALAWKNGIGKEDIKRGLETFTGVERRFDIKFNNDDLVLVDDYAHHPDEIDTTISTARMLFGNRKITVVFQPHLYSRTRDFAAGFARSLDNADRVILLPVYPAREKPVEGVNSDVIYDKMKNPDKMLLEKTGLIDELLKVSPKVLIMMGAGDIGFLVNDVKNALTQK